MSQNYLFMYSWDDNLQEVKTPQELGRQEKNVMNIQAVYNGGSKLQNTI